MIKLFLLLLLCVPLVLGAPEPLAILSIQYDNGAMHIVNRSLDFGYVPDRKLQPEQGYNLSIYDSENLLYSFVFSPPTKEYLDGRNGGGIFERRYFVFPLVVPAYAQEERIEIRKDNEVITSSGETYSKKTYWIALVLIGIVTLLILLGLRQRNHALRAQ